MPRKPRVARKSATGVPENIYQTFTAGFGYLCHLDKGWKDRQTEDQLRRAWSKYRDAIMRRDEETYRAWGKIIGKRSWAYFEYELEPKHPRLLIGSEKWLGPQCGPAPRKWVKDGFYEDDATYLARLGLLYPWEIEMLKSRSAK